MLEAPCQLPLPERVIAKIQQRSNGCWIWTGSTTVGGHLTYGQVWWDGKARVVHRVVYSQVHCVEIRPTQLVRHACDNPLCVNPAHLSLGSHKDNMRDMVTRGRQARGDNLSRLIRGERNGHAKLREKDVLSIRKKAKSGMPQKQIADAYGISSKTVSNIVTRRKWKHLPEEC